MLVLVIVLVLEIVLEIENVVFSLLLVMCQYLIPVRL